MVTPGDARTLLRLTSGAAVLVDLEGRMVLSSPSACALLGRTHGELARARWQDLTHPDDVPAGELVWREARQQLERRQLLKRYTLRGGRLLFAELDAQPVVVNGCAVGVLSQLRPWHDAAASPSFGGVDSDWRVRARPPKGRDGRSWQLVYQRPDGTRYQRSAQTRSEAEARALAESEERRLRGVSLDFAEVARQYLAWRQEGGHKASTVRRYRQALDRVAEALGRLEASRESVLVVQDALRAELHPNTVNLYMGMAGTAWAWALERGLVDRPWAPPRKLRAPKTAKRPLTAEESERLLGVLEAYEGGRYHALFALIVETGCRAGEACALEGRDVDRDLGEVRFRVTKTDVDRSVPVSQALLASLPRVGPQEPLWRGRITGRAMTSCTLYSIWKRVRVLAGLGDEAVDVHSLRRSWITDAHRAGVPLAESMRVTGHRSPRVHLGYTANAPTSRTREAAAAVRAFRSGAPHQIPPHVGGDPVKHKATEGDTGLTRRGCSQASLRKAMQHYDFRNLTPPQRKRLASLIDAVAGQGEREAAALLAVAECAELRASLLELAQQDR